jgi:hypothetical protein
MPSRKRKRAREDKYYLPDKKIMMEREGFP